MSEPLRQLGRYELLRRIAVGGMGEIFLARMRGAGGFEKRVIIKTILPHLAEEQEFITKFLDEGRIVVQLTHGNIVPVFDMGQHDQEYFIAMEYIPGRDLREVLKRLQVDAQIMPLDMAVYIISEVCKGLGYAHRKLDEYGDQLELVHRDVSPSNILISHEGEVKVIDFGIARATGRLSETVSGRIQGKFSYMSPEQASGKAVDARSDIFSTGVVFYEMLTGARPFQGTTDLESLELVRRCEFTSPSILNPQLPPAIEQIVARALAKEPKARYQSIDQMQDDLLQYLYTQGQAPRAKQFAQFLKSLFPEGFERRDLRVGTSSASGGSERSSQSSPKAPSSSGAGRAVSLDDALDMELDRLLQGDAPEETRSESALVDPLTATADSFELALEGPRTATLAPTPVNTPLEPHSPDAPADEDVVEEAEAVETPEAAALPASVEASSSPLEPPEDEPADEDADAQHRRRRDRLREAAPHLELDLFRVKGVKRTLAIGLIGFVVFIGLALFAFNTWQDRKVGQVQLDSAPSGAEIYVDGAKLPGLTTPATITLSVGTHTIQLRKRGFTATAPLSVTLKRGQLVVLPADDVRLVAEPSAQPKRRRFKILSEPIGARLSVDHSSTDEAQEGVTPWFVELGPGEFANLKAEQDGCKPRAMPLTFDQASDEVNIVLNCQAAIPQKPEDMGKPVAPPDKTQPAHHRPKKRLLVVSVTPPEAALSVNAGERKVEGKGRLSIQVEPQDEVTILATLQGYEPYKERLKASQISGASKVITLEAKAMGCLTFRAEYPHENEYILDGRSLGRSYGLKAQPVSAGKHTLIVRNTQVNKEERFALEIEPGKTCLSRSVWPRPN